MKSNINFDDLTFIASSELWKFWISHEKKKKIHSIYFAFFYYFDYSCDVEQIFWLSIGLIIVVSILASTRWILNIDDNWECTMRTNLKKKTLSPSKKSSSIKNPFFMHTQKIFNSNKMNWTLISSNSVHPVTDSINKIHPRRYWSDGRLPRRHLNLSLPELLLTPNVLDPQCT